MKNIKKNALKIVVLIALCAPAAFADGDMPGGGLVDEGNGPNSGEVVIAQVSDASVTGSDVSSFMSAVYEYLNLMF